MRVFVNNHPVEVYPGASVRHALLRYSDTVYQEAVAGKLVVTDRHGNRLGLGGPLEEGLRLTVQGPGGYRPGPAVPVSSAPASPALTSARAEMAAPASDGVLSQVDRAADVRSVAGSSNGQWPPRRRRRGRRRGQRRRNRPRHSPAQEN